MMRILILGLATFLPLALSDQSWCNLPSCDAREHVDCTMADGSFAAACPSSTVMLNLEPSKTTIVDRFNTIRDRVAGGSLTGFFAATHMGTLQWDIQLANLARRSVKKCVFVRDGCVNTPELDFVGENIARAVYGSTDTRTNIQVINDLITAWFNQYTSTTMANIRSFPSSSLNIASFCQIVRDASTRVGCAALKWTSGTQKTLMFTCLFDVGNNVGLPVYDDGPNASECVTGRNPATGRSNLCSTDEVYVVNPA